MLGNPKSMGSGILIVDDRQPQKVSIVGFCHLPYTILLSRIYYGQSGHSGTYGSKTVDSAIVRSRLEVAQLLVLTWS